MISTKNSKLMVLWAMLKTDWMISFNKSDKTNIYCKKYITLYRFSLIPADTENILKIFINIETLNIEQVA